MRGVRFHAMLSCWLIAGTMLSAAQVKKADAAAKSDGAALSAKPHRTPQAKKPQIATRKAGLWEITTTMTWQQSPFDPGTAKGIADGANHTEQYCFSQEAIDSYGVLLPQSHGDCHIENKVMRLGGITADWVCRGKINGKGELETNWSDLEHATGKLHFWGTFQGGQNVAPIEWTTVSSSVFKSESCGNMPPFPIPGK